MTTDHEIQYQFVNDQIRYHNEKVMEAYAGFTRIFSLVVGGAIWLRIQEKFDATDAPKYALLANILVTFITLVTIVIIVENVRAWYGYRQAQVKLGGNDTSGTSNVPGPRPWHTYYLELVMMIAIVAVTVLFWVFNPFLL